MAGGFANIINGAVSGAAAGPWGAAAGVAASLIPTALKYFQARKQRRMADAINPTDPGFVANQGILDNQRIVQDRWNNYTLPGREAIENNIASSYATGMNLATQGASSSGDLLDSAARLSALNARDVSALGVQEAQMKEALLPELLNANAMAGNEAVRRNEFDEARYQAQLAEKNALMGASMQNNYGVANDIGTLGGSILNYKAQPWTRQPIRNFKSLGSALS